MAFTVAGFELQRARAVLPETGVWSARAQLVGDKAPARGARVPIVLGDLTLSGTVRFSEVHVGRAELLVVGGADRWGATVQRRAYRANNGVRLSLVAGDLARDAGELLGPLTGLERAVVGYAWVRPEGPASTALEELGRPWYVDLGGTTQLGTWPAVVRSGLRLGVESYRPSLRRAELTSPDDALASFVPGSVISGEGIPTLTLIATTIHVTERKAVAEVEFS
jgi:hypothetical protein